jgi:predicted nucleotidyltransferase
LIEADDIIAGLRTALPELRRNRPVRTLALVGSCVRNDARPDSDLDVLAKFSGPVTLSSSLALEEKLAAITVLRVDLVAASL